MASPQRPLSSVPKVAMWVYATEQQEEEDGKMLMYDKRDRAITYVFCRDLH